MCRLWNSFAVSTTFFQGRYCGRSLTISRWFWSNSKMNRKRRTRTWRQGHLRIYEPLRVGRGDEKYVRLTKSRWREAAGSQRHGVQYDGLSLSTRYTIGYKTSHNKQIRKQIHSARRTKRRTTSKTGLLHSLVSNTIAWSNPEKKLPTHPSPTASLPLLP